MIKRTVTYEDFDGNKVTEDLYFHLSMKELSDMAVSEDGGLLTRLENIMKSQDGAAILNAFNMIIGASYGTRVDNNPSKFFKSEAQKEQFLTSLAYDQLFSDLITDPTGAAEFINGIVPKDLLARAKAVQAVQDTSAGNGITQDRSEILTDDASLVAATGLANPRDGNGDILPWAYRKPTNSEQQRMNRKQLLEVMQRQSSGWVPRDQ